MPAEPLSPDPPFGSLSTEEGEKRLRAFVREVVACGGREALLRLIDQEAFLAGRGASFWHGDPNGRQTFLFP